MGIQTFAISLIEAPYWGGGFFISRQHAERICAKDSTDVHSCQ